MEGASEWVSLGVHRLKGVGEDELWGLLHPELRREFPPLETLDPVRHNLPPVSAPLFGREAQLREWRALLRGPVHLLTLCAFGGLGKTRAALALAESLVADFPAGAWWVDAASARSATDLWRAIALALRLEIAPSRSLDAQVLEFLAPKTLLLCLDNLEQIPDAAGVVAAILERAPGVRVLGATRHALRLRQEHLAPVPPLGEDEGALLFAERALAAGARVEASSPQVRSLVRRLEGIPLAIQLAAARARLLSPATIEARLADRFRLLGTASPDVPARQSTLVSLIDWSFDLLGPIEADALLHLSAWAGGASVEAFCALEGETGDEWAALDALDEMVARSFVRRDEGRERVSLFESVALYTAGKQRDAEAARGEAAPGELAWRHARFFAQWSGQRIALLRTPDEATALRQLSDDDANIERALDVARHTPREEAGALVGALALHLGVARARHGLARDAIRVFDEALADGRVPPQHEAQLRRERAGALLDDGQLDEAAEEAEHALRLAARRGQTRDEARARLVLGLVHLESGRTLPARREFEAALAACEAADDGEGQAMARHNLGTLAFGAGKFAQAGGFWNAALRERRQRGDRRGLAETLCNLGVLAQEQGDLKSAASLAGEALEHELALEHLTGTARALFNLGELAELSEEPGRAMRFYGASARVFERVASPLLPLVLEARARVEAKAALAAPLVAPDVALGDIVAWAQTP